MPRKEVWKNRERKWNADQHVLEAMEMVKAKSSESKINARLDNNATDIRANCIAIEYKSVKENNLQIGLLMARTTTLSNAG